MVDSIEFLQRTDKRQLQTHIRFKVKEALRERDEELERRRERLRMMLFSEELQQEEQLANIFRARVLENAQKRLDWISAAKFEKSEAEKEFLKLKAIQRELLNCEEMRPKESKKLTEEIKMAQLFQISEKKAIQMKEKEIDKIWHEASMFLEREKDKQQQYENDLRRIIANKSVEVLNGQLEEIKRIKEVENEEKKEENLRIERANHEDQLKMGFEERHKLSKKIKEGAEQKNYLQSMASEKVLKAQKIKLSEAQLNEIQNIQQQQEEDIAKANRELDKESHTRYLQYVKDKKSEMNCRNKMLDTALVAHGRRMESPPINKIPYQKSVR